MNLINILKNPPTYLLMFLVVVVVVLSSVYWATGRAASQSLLGNALQKQLVITRAGSLFIRGFFDLAGKSLALLAQHTELDSENADHQAILDQFVSDWSGSPIVGLVLTDHQGVVTNNANINQSPETGTDLSDREYFAWAKQARPNQFFVSRPILSRLGASKGKEIAIIATPVFKNEKFNGVLAVAVVLEKFATLYLQDFNVSSATDVYLFDADGTILISPETKNIGQNAFDLISANPFLGDRIIVPMFRKVLAEGQEGSADLVVPTASGNKLTRSLITYAPIKNLSVNGQTWMLVVTSPTESILSLIAPTYIKELTLVIGVFFALLILIMVWMRWQNRQIAQRSVPKQNPNSNLQ